MCTRKRREQLRCVQNLEDWQGPLSPNGRHRAARLVGAAELVFEGFA